MKALLAKRNSSRLRLRTKLFPSKLSSQAGKPRQESGSVRARVAVAVGGDEALPAVAGLAGYAAYLIRPDGSETDTGIEFAR